MAPRVASLATLMLALAASAAAQARPSPLDAHSLNPDSEYLVADQPFEGGWATVTLARMVRPASRATGGEAEFMGIGSNRAGQTFRSRWFWRTRAARPEELRIGQLVFCLDAQTSGVYHAPRTRTEATQTAWFAGPVVDLSGLTEGQVIVDTYRAEPGCLRVAEAGAGDLPPPTPPDLDTQFVDTADYFVRTEEYEGGYGGYVTMARMVRGPTTASSGEAEFVSLQGTGGHRTGQRFWTRHFWRTRVATPQDLRDGTTVVALDAQDGGTYRPPRDRFEALTVGWWVGAITDLSGMFRGEVQVGEYRTRPDALRVIVRN